VFYEIQKNEENKINSNFVYLYELYIKSTSQLKKNIKEKNENFLTLIDDFKSAIEELSNNASKKELQENAQHAAKNLTDFLTTLNANLYESIEIDSELLKGIYKQSLESAKSYEKITSKELNKTKNEIFKTLNEIIVKTGWHLFFTAEKKFPLPVFPKEKIIDLIDNSLDTSRNSSLSQLYVQMMKYIVLYYNFSEETDLLRLETLIKTLIKTLPKIGTSPENFTDIEIQSIIGVFKQIVCDPYFRDPETIDNFFNQFIGKKTSVKNDQSSQNATKFFNEIDHMWIQLYRENKFDNRIEPLENKKIINFISQTSEKLNKRFPEIDFANGEEYKDLFEDSINSYESLQKEKSNKITSEENYINEQLDLWEKRYIKSNKSNSSTASLYGNISFYIYEYFQSLLNRKEQISSDVKDAIARFERSPEEQQKDFLFQVFLSVVSDSSARESYNKIIDFYARKILKNESEITINEINDFFNDVYNNFNNKKS
jgi:hypothetical protein